MKNILYLSMIIAIVLAGCTPDAEYYSQVAPGTFYQNQNQVYQRVGRTYTHFYYGMTSNLCRSSFLEMQELTTDEIVLPARFNDWYDGGGYLEYYYHQFSPEMQKNGVYNIWYMFSMGAAQTLSAIEDLETFVDFDALNFPAGSKEAIIAQLRFINCWYYLIGLDAFGGIPIYEVGDKETKGRLTARETFDYIEKELLEIKDLLPKKQQGAEETGYPFAGAAAALLCKLYLNAEFYTDDDLSDGINGEAMYDKAAQIAQEIIDGKYGYYALANSFQDIWGFSNETSSEIIYTIPTQNVLSQRGASSYVNMFHYRMPYYLGTREYNGDGGYNGYCLTPSIDVQGRNYNANIHDNPTPKQYLLGCPFSKFEEDDLRKQLYGYKGNGEYQGMFLFGPLINPITGSTCDADGSRDFEAGTVINKVDQIAHISTKRAGDLLGKEGADMADENSGIHWIKASPIPNEADKQLLYNPDIPVIRLAEIYYTLAECKYRQGDKQGAAELINKVRSRYFKPLHYQIAVNENSQPIYKDFDGIDDNPVTPANLNDSRLLDEWMIEFFSEGRRRTDLIRFNQFVHGEWWDHTPTHNEFYNRFPLDIDILSASEKLIQNPGYN